ncbi:MAG: acyl-CoA hydrolase [Haloarculaceae archaeon]|jgi:acyl-CoA hydrolase
MTDAETARLTDSLTEMTDLLTPDETNDLDRALGGVVIHWMDVCGVIAAMRCTGERCVTAAIDAVEFYAPIRVGEVVTVEGYVYDVGRRSIDAIVEVTAEAPTTGETRDVAVSFLTYVAIDEDGRPTAVPELVCETDAERERREHALERRKQRLAELLAQLEE